MLGSLEPPDGVVILVVQRVILMIWWSAALAPEVAVPVVWAPRLLLGCHCDGRVVTGALDLDAPGIALAAHHVQLHFRWIRLSRAKTPRHMCRVAGVKGTA